MLKRLEISNYALIENVQLTLDRGFTVITGETGAGKSILLKALNLLLGERADTSVLRKSDKKCILEAEFDVAGLELEPFFEAHELDYESTCLIRREFNAAGKSRTFINDTPVQLAQLKNLGQQLISIHTQHQTLALLAPEFQLDVLDHYAGIEKKVRDYTSVYRQYRKAVNSLIELQVKDKENRKEKDYLTFLLQELEEADLRNTDVEELQRKALKLEHNEKIQTALQFARSVVENDEYGPTVGIKTLLETFDELKQYDVGYADIAARLLSLKIELDDIEREINNADTGDYFSEEDALLIKEKLDKFNALVFKHNVNSLDDLLTLQTQLENNLNAISNVEAEIERLEQEITQYKTKLRKIATELSQKRTAAIPKLEKEIQKRLEKLAMPEARLQIKLEQKEQLNTNGLDDINFLFKTNPGSDFAPIKKVASGGELSRLMLTVLSVLSEKKKLPTLIFDEIDTGVSGEVAAKIAAEFHQMGSSIQLIAITHLPQVAGRGHAHLHVAKVQETAKTTTTVRSISGAERIDILARMISGEEITEAARENASQLLTIR